MSSDADGLVVLAEDARATREVGSALAAVLRAGDLVVLSGGLGAGKTTMTQGLGEGLGVRGQVASPTFVIAREHPSTVGGPALVHVDAYRLGSLEEVDALDLDSSLTDSVTVVEWGAGKVEGLAQDRLEIELVRPRGAGDVAGAHGDAAAAPAVPDSPDSPDPLASLDVEALAQEAPREIRVRPVGARWTAPGAADALARALGTR